MEYPHASCRQPVAPLHISQQSDLNVLDERRRIDRWGRHQPPEYVCRWARFRFWVSSLLCEPYLLRTAPPHECSQKSQVGHGCSHFHRGDNKSARRLRAEDYSELNVARLFYTARLEPVLTSPECLRPPDRHYCMGVIYLYKQVVGFVPGPCRAF